MPLSQMPQRIRLLREQRGWSQNYLAKKTGIPQPTIWHLERGDIERPNVECLRLLADAFEVSIDSLVRDEVVVLNVSKHVTPQIEVK